MRLIDGDELLKRVQQEKIQEQVHGREFSTCFMSPGGTPSTEWWFVEDLIENVPTIEPELCEDAVSRNAIIQKLNTMDRYVSEELILCDTDKKFPKNEVFIVDDVYEEIVENLPSAQPRTDCVLKEFGNCSYSETGCSDCKVKVKIRNALSAQPEPCEDAVSRTELLHIFEENCYPVHYDHNSIDVGMTLPGIVEVLNIATSVASKRKEGKWIKRDVSRQIHGISCSAPNYQCSVCKKWWFHNGEGLKWYKFCPECGADMRGEQNEQTN